MNNIFKNEISTGIFILFVELCVINTKMYLSITIEANLQVWLLVTP
jgi:hypothetical protein